MTISGTVLAPAGNTPATYTNINTDAGRLAGGGTVLSYLKQNGGDMATWDPYPAFDGIVKVLAPDNSVLKTISVQADLGSAGRAVNDVTVQTLAHGGFVVGWSDYSDANDYGNTMQAHYALYDDSGNLQTSGLLSATGGNNVRIASLADGGFATVFLATGTAHSQQGVVNTFLYDAGSGTYLHQAESYVGDPNNNAPGAGTDVTKLSMLGEADITALSDGGFVVSAPTYDWVSSTYTPLGDFIFNYSATGAQENFASGYYWQRVNWNPGQINDVAQVAAFTGGFASLNRGHNGQWQVTLYHDDGSLITTNQMTDQVSHAGSYDTRTYYANDLAPVVTPPVGTGVNGLNLDDFVTLVDNGGELLAVLPNSAGGFDFAHISKTTGALTLLENSGIAVPSGATLANPRLLHEGGGFDITYDVLTTSGAYTLASTYEYGLTAPVNTAPVVAGIDGDATDFIVGTPQYVDGGNDYADVYDTDSSSFDGGYLQVRQTSGGTDGGFSFDLTVGTTQILWGSGAQPDTANDGAKFTAQHALAVGDKVWYGTGLSTDPADWILIGTVVADGQNGHDLKISFSNTEATIPSGAGMSDSYASLLLKYLMYTAPSLGARDFVVAVNDGDGATSTPVGLTMTGTSDQSSTITAAAGVAEPVKLPVSADSAGGAVAVFDFTVTDAGSGDGLATRITALTLDATGSGDFYGVTWLLTGPGIGSAIAGSYDPVTHKLTFANAGIVVADGAAAVYTVKAYFADPAGAVPGTTFALALDGDSGVTLATGLSSQMAGAQAPVTNGSGSVVVAGPSVLSVAHATPAHSPTNADSLSWTVSFGEAVQHVDAADFDVAGLTGETIVVAAAGTNAYTVTVSGGGLAGLDGTVTLGLAAGQDIVNGDGLALAGLAPSGTDERSWVVDNTAPSAPGTPDLQDASDSGSSHTDNRTNVTAPTFSGSAEAGATVTLYDGDGTVLGTGVATGGTWTIQSIALAPGAHTVSARAVDAAGNGSAASAATTVVVDTAVAAPGLGPVNDTGAGATDGLTRDGRIDVTLAADAAGWEYSTDGGVHWTAGSGAGFTLGEGSYEAGQVQVRQTDTAGNVSAAASVQALTVDTTVAAPGLALAQDTGASGSDGITRNGTMNATLASDAAGWEYSDDGGAHWSAGSGTSFTLGDGHYATGQVQVRQTDRAGNVSAAAANMQALTIASGVGAPGVALANDTGVSGTDGVTKIGTVAAALATDVAGWEYSTDGGAHWTAGSGTGFTLGEGSYAAGQVQVRQTDLAGNTSSAGSNAQAIKVDATVAAPAFALAHDTGASGTDGVTADGTIAVTLAADAAGWDYSTDGGAHWTAGSGTDFTLGAGSYAAGQVLVRQTDVAGNVSAAQPGTQPLTVLAPLPAPTLALQADTGANAADGISTNGGVNVVLAAGAVAWEYRTTVDGAWTAGTGTAFVLGEGGHDAGTVQVRQIDAAGNVGAIGSNAAAIVVDNVAPVVQMLVRPALSGPEGTTPFTVEVHYADGGAGVDPASVGVGDLSVTGPGAAGALAVTGATFDAAHGIAVYTVAAPAGGWNDAAAGTYIVEVGAGAVRDLAGNALAGGASQQFEVTFNAAPHIDSNGGGAEAAIELVERATAVTTVHAIDADAGDTVSYSITGGADAALFRIDAATGALSLRDAPSAQTPQDSDHDNVYLVNVGASDGHGGVAAQALAVKVLADADGDGTPDVHDDDLDGDGRPNSAEDPVPSANGGATGDGNGDGIADSTQVNVASLATVGSVAPALRFATIEVAPGLSLSGVANSAVNGLPRNAKMPLGQFDFRIEGVAVGGSVDIALYVDKSLGANGYYKQVGSTWINLATTSTFGTKTKISFTLTDGGAYDADGVANGVIVDPGGPVVIAPRITSAGGAADATLQVYENRSAVATIAAQALGTVSYSISGGADRDKFTIDPVSGKLAWVAAPDYEHPTDVGAGVGNNTYAVEVTASDAFGSDTQFLTVRVLDVDENPAPVDDGDSIPPQVEHQVPSLPTAGGTVVAGDGNGDGVADDAQSNVTSLPFLHTDHAQSHPDGAPQVYLTLVADSVDGKTVPAQSGATVLNDVRQLDAPADAPADLKMPLGLISFSANVSAAGAAKSFSIYVDGDVPVNGYWKQDAHGNWVNLADAAHGGKVVTESGHTRLDFTIVDGGEFDADGKADGVITDPGAPGWRAPADGDSDRDQFPDALEAAHGLQVGVKDNDVFASNKLFVMELYRDLLFREAAAPETTFWQGLLDAGMMNKAQLVSTFLDSAEFQGGAAAVARIEYAALDRVPDQAGLAYWTHQVSAGQALSAVAGAISGSAEFTAKYGQLDDAAFVKQLYQNVLHRPGDQAGVDFWTAQLGAHATRGDVLLGLAQSHEYKAATDADVTATLGYLGLLGRDAAPAEVAYWVGKLDAGVPEVDVIGTFLAAPEYHDRFLP